MKNKLRKINTALSFFNVQLRKGSFFTKPSTNFVKSLRKEDLICIEIGVYRGRNALNIFENLNVKKLFLIDPYENYIESTSKENPQRIIEDYMLNEAKLRLFDFKDEIQFMKVSSKGAVKHFKNNSIDFIYIDGNHGYKFVKEDIKLYYPKLKKGGILAGDDINLEDVFQAVSEFCVNNNLKCKIKDRDWIIVK